MSNNLKTKKTVRLIPYVLGVSVLWSLLIAISLIWNMKIEKTGTFDAARIEARTAFEKDVIYRRWNAEHGGVYVPVTEKTQPNPYLDVTERDIITPLGKKLTKINPAYMTRQVHEIAMQAYGVKGHITSLNPIRPANAPDFWETQALKGFQAGEEEVSSVEKMEGKYYMRLMSPLLTESGCLKCHAVQGYKLGDIRGGISVATPMAPLLAIGRSRIITFSIVLGLLWLIGLAGIGFSAHRLSQQIHKRIGTEEALRESEEKYRGIFDESIATVYLFDDKKKFIDSNEAGLDLLGYSIEELLSMSIPEVDADPIVVLPAHEQLLGGERIINYEHRLKRKDGKVITVLNNSKPITDTDGHVIGMQSTLIDITERKQAEDQIKVSLKEKEVLLREIHHRVKNNMQVIISLLRLRADKIEDKKYAEMFKESEDRIRSMALIHQQLYQSKDFANIDFGEYINNLANDLFTSYGIDVNKIRLNVEVEDVLLDLETAIPCGLIINELVSNSLKHAFKQSTDGNISIILRSTNDDELELTISDDGVGIPKDLDIRDTELMGLHLIRILAEQQLEGKIDVDRTEGTQFNIKFKRTAHKPRT